MFLVVTLGIVIYIHINYSTWERLWLIITKAMWIAYTVDTEGNYAHLYIDSTYTWKHSFTTRASGIQFRFSVT